MGSGASRETVIDSKWWEAEAHHTLTTATDPRKVERICSLIPVQDDKTLLRPLMGRPDLDTLFTLHCGRRELPGHESENPSKVTDDIKAQELWRVLRPPSEYHAPWDWNWPLSGDPRQIADDFHAVVSRAIFVVPLSDFVKCALGYNSQALSVDALLDAACDARNSLQRAIQGLPQTKDTRRDIVVTVPPVSSLDRCQQPKQHDTCSIRCLGLDPRPDQEPVHNTQPRFRTQETCGSRRI